MTRISKQVLVMRKKFLVNGELRKVRTGKYISQACHSSLGAILNQMTKEEDGGNMYLTLSLSEDEALFDWIKGSFTKVTLCVETEEELLEIYNKGKDAGLITCLITDSGRTEFNGIPTKTCCSILGWSDEVDEITGKLELF